MSEYKQQLSACLDGELSDDEIRRLQADVEAGAFSTSSRYQVIGAAIRNDVEDADLIDISHTVRVAVLQEQSYATNSTAAAKTGRARGFWWRPLGGMAVAASVALVMVMTLTDEQSGDTAQLASQAKAIQIQAPLAAVPAPAPLLAVNPVVDNNSRPVANLNTYLSEHSESAARDTMQGRLPYARAVSYESK